MGGGGATARARHPPSTASHGRPHTASTAREPAAVNHRFTPAERARLAGVEGIEYLPPDSAVYRRWLAGQWEPVTTRTVAEHLGIGEDGAVMRLREAGALRVGRWPSLWVAP